MRQQTETANWDDMLFFVLQQTKAPAANYAGNLRFDPKDVVTCCDCNLLIALSRWQLRRRTSSARVGKHMVWLGRDCWRCLKCSLGSFSATLHETCHGAHAVELEN